MDDMQTDWIRKFNYREAAAVDSCELCSYANRIDTDRDRRVEALSCEACADDTGASMAVDFGSICDLYLPGLLEEQAD